MEAAQNTEAGALTRLGPNTPRHVRLIDESTNSPKPPMIALLLELRRIQNDGPAHCRYRCTRSLQAVLGCCLRCAVVEDEATMIG